MKKILALILSLLLCSSVFARQYIMDITSTGNLIHNVSVIRALQEDLTNVLIDLVKKGYKIVQVVPTTADGSIIGYVVIYEDVKE
jgi:predicted CoA-binding protein